MQTHIATFGCQYSGVFLWVVLSEPQGMNLNRFHVITSQVVEVVAEGHPSCWACVNLTRLVGCALHHEGDPKGALKFCNYGIGGSFARLSGLDNVDRFSNPLSQLLLTPVSVAASLSDTSMKIIGEFLGRASHDVVFLPARRWGSGDVACSLEAGCLALRCKVHFCNATVASGDFCLPSPDAFNGHFDSPTEFTFAHKFHPIVTLFEPFGTAGVIVYKAIS